MNESNIPTSKKKSNFSRTLLIAILLIVIAVLGFHLLAPLLGIVLAVSLMGWTAIVVTVVFFSIATLLFFVLPGVFIFIISVLALVWVVLAIIFFPILFPIVIPFFIILLCIAYFQKKQ